MEMETAMENKTFTVAGGDLRQCCLANLLARTPGTRVFGLCMENCTELDAAVTVTGDLEGVLPQSDVVIFPLPLSGDEVLINAPFCERPPLVTRCFQAISPFAAVFGGMVSPRMERMAEKYGLVLHDYYAREELIVANCIPTAEGALAIAMQETARTIFGSRCLVTGYGRVGKAMARLLGACGARVSVAARKQGDLAWIRLAGFEAVPMGQLAGAAGQAELIFNTVPVQLFDETMLESVKRDCVLIDLASKPGGVDFGAAKRLGRKVIWALSLPGKVAPVTAAEIVRDTVFGMLAELGG